MLAPELGELLRPAVRSQRIIWAAMTVSIPFYIGVVYYLHFSEGESPVPASIAYAEALYATAGLLTVASLMFQRYCGSDSRFESTLREKVHLDSLIRGPELKKKHPEYFMRLEALSPFDRTVYGLLATRQAALIISLVLHEAVALLGFVHGFLSRNAGTMIPFAITAIALNMLVFPRPEAEAERAYHWIHLNGG